MVHKSLGTCAVNNAFSTVDIFKTLSEFGCRHSRMARWAESAVLSRDSAHMRRLWIRTTPGSDRNVLATSWKGTSDYFTSRQFQNVVLSSRIENISRTSDAARKDQYRILISTKQFKLLLGAVVKPSFLTSRGGFPCGENICINLK